MWTNICCLLCQWPYQIEHTTSHQITEVKQHWAKIGLRWETAWELLMLLDFFIFFISSSFAVLDVILVLFEASFPTRHSIYQCTPLDLLLLVDVLKLKNRPHKAYHPPSRVRVEPCAVLYHPLICVVGTFRIIASVPLIHILFIRCDITNNTGYA